MKAMLCGTVLALLGIASTVHAQNAAEQAWTWQAMAGVGYRFGWGEASLVYRHLAYDFKSDSEISDLGLSGPAIGASFAF